MAFLLDTHTVLWYLNGDSQLSIKAKQVIDDSAVKKFFSIASCWEIAIKTGLNKIRIEYSFDEMLQKLSPFGFSLLHIELHQLKVIQTLPFYHRDPFDRLLIAQSLSENLTIVSKDKNFSLYPVQLLW
ncbi:MAG TPA: type II toxin-antitoxin system VapC family toxin [Ferruginibacter sp.]|mgnify:CR=1 FL=1|nr:type II toxin-antitoxin system VapC family toxin [Ferruginibacter sp.]HMP21935.1 type II toxin-antitoxin system VapC family toxin [Ferruginibacter sp.]